MSFLPLFFLADSSSIDLSINFLFTGTVSSAESGTMSAQKHGNSKYSKSTAADAHGKLPKHIPLKSTCYAFERFKTML